MTYENKQEKRTEERKGLVARIVGAIEEFFFRERTINYELATLRSKYRAINAMRDPVRSAEKELDIAKSQAGFYGIF